MKKSYVCNIVFTSAITVNAKDENEAWAIVKNMIREGKIKPDSAEVTDIVER